MAHRFPAHTHTHLHFRLHIWWRTIMSLQVNLLLCKICWSLCVFMLTYICIELLCWYALILALAMGLHVVLFVLFAVVAVPKSRHSSYTIHALTYINTLLVLSAQSGLNMYSPQISNTCAVLVTTRFKLHSQMYVCIHYFLLLLMSFSAFPRGGIAFDVMGIRKHSEHNGLRKQYLFSCIL